MAWLLWELLELGLELRASALVPVLVLVLQGMGLVPVMDFLGSWPMRVWPL